MTFLLPRTGFFGVLHLWQEESAKVAQKRWDLSSMTSQLVVRKKKVLHLKVMCEELSRSVTETNQTDSELQQLGKGVALHFVVHNTLSRWICCGDVWDRVNAWELSLRWKQIDTLKFVELNTNSYRIRLNKQGNELQTT